jgi:hypothetical protein
MLEQIAIVATAYTTALFITMLTTIILIGAYWTKNSVRHK